MTHLALAPRVKNPRVSTVILGASKEEQLHDNRASLSAVEKLTPDLTARIDVIARNKPPQPERFGR